MTPEWVLPENEVKAYALLLSLRTGPFPLVLVDEHLPTNLIEGIEDPRHAIKDGDALESFMEGWRIGMGDLEESK